MARQNRRNIFDPNEVGAFHAVQRTVRRAWLCGTDPISVKSFEHRRTWIQKRLQELAASFGIDCLSFAVMVRQIRRGNKKGRIPTDLAPILERIGLSGELWCDVVTGSLRGLIRCLAIAKS